MGARERGAQLALRIQGQLRADRFGERPQDGPVLTGVAGREYRTIRELGTAFHVDVGSRLLRIGGAGKDHVSAMRALVAVGSDKDERAGPDFDFVGAEIEITRSRPAPPSRGCPGRRDRDGARIEAADARGGAVQHIEAVPARLDDAEPLPLPRAQNSRAVWSREGARAQYEHPVGLIGRRMIGEARERFPFGAEVIVSVSQVGPFADDADRQAPLSQRLRIRALTPATRPRVGATIRIASAVSIPGPSN